jgi:hypothetical protein
VEKLLAGAHAGSVELQQRYVVLAIGVEPRQRQDCGSATFFNDRSDACTIHGATSATWMRTTESRLPCAGTGDAVCACVGLHNKVHIADASNRQVVDNITARPEPMDT